MRSMKAIAGRILEVLKSYPTSKTMPSRVLERKLGEDKAALAKALNHLLQEHKIQCYHVKDEDGHKTLHYKLGELKLKHLSSEELLVYQIIEQSNDRGIWTRDIKLRSNLQQPAIAKILKTLESRALIKSVKWVTNKNRKVYMLMEVEPSREITGGAWYTDNEMDEELVHAAKKICLKFVEKTFKATGRRATVGDVGAHVRGTQIIKTEMKDDEIRAVLKVLVYDGKLDEYRAAGAEDEDEDGLEYAPALCKPPKGLPEHLVEMLEVGWLVRSGEKRPESTKRGEDGSVTPSRLKRLFSEEEERAEEVGGGGGGEERDLYFFRGT